MMDAHQTYEYDFDLDGNRSASRVARLVGSGKRVLELGCGPGSQSRVFSEKLSCNVVGVEIDPERAERAKAYCRKVLVADLERSDIRELVAPEQFDVVVCADVLEHLRAPESLLSKIKDLISPGGYLVASVPNITHASIVYEMIHGRFEYRNEGLLDATHIKFFSHESLLRLFEDAGFCISEIQRVRSKPQNTEFKTTAISAEDRALLMEISRRNRDSETYQFVIKAYPLGDCASDNHPTLALSDEVLRLRQLTEEYEAELNRLRSQSQWQDRPISARIADKLRRIFKKHGRPSESSAHQ